ncbi:MAG: SCP2 sterol-binding domain-containing protein [Acidimicrobiales bacterium]
MATYPFLSDPWLEEARAIRAEYEGRGTTIDHSIRMNLVISEVPFDPGVVNAHVDTSSGELLLDTGHLDSVDLTVSLAYDVAKAILVEGNPQRGLQAFMTGEVRVDGDIAKLMALQTLAPNPIAADIASRILDITE